MPHDVSAEKISGTWEPSSRGVMRQLPAHRIPVDGLFEAKNVMYYKGFIVHRDGLTGLTQDGIVARPVGITSIASLAESAFAPTAFDGAFDTSPDLSYLLAMSTKALWARWGNLWHNLMPGSGGTFDVSTPTFDPLSFSGLVASDVLSADEDLHGEFAVMEIGDNIKGPGLYVMCMNGRDEPRLWDTRLDTVSVMSDWPRFKDGLQLEARFVGLEGPYAVRWGESLSITPPLDDNVRFLAETTDPTVAIVNLGGVTQFVVFKEETIWEGRVLGGPSSSFFQFIYRGRFSGPASSAAVSVYDGIACYMTPTGRIGIYDGASHRWPCEGAWVQVRDGSTTFPKLDAQYSNRIFSVVNPFKRLVYFYYPQEGDNGDCNGVVVLTLPDPEAGVDSFGAFPGRLGIPLSAATTREGKFQDAVVMRSDGEFTAFTVSGDLDASVPIDGYWQTGLVAAHSAGFLTATGSMEPYRMEGHESFFERGAGYGIVSVRPISSYILDKQGGTVGNSHTIDLSSVTVKEQKGGDVKGRFFGLRYEFTTPSNFIWQGARLAARRIEGTAKLTTK